MTDQVSLLFVISWPVCLFIANGGGPVEVRLRLFIKTVVGKKNHPTTKQLIFFPSFLFFFLHSSKRVERPEN